MENGVLVTGATGNIGLFAAKKLAAEGARVRAAVTDPRRASNVLDGEFELARFDFLDQGTYTEALTGTDRILLIRPPVLNNPKAFYPFIDAAKTADIRHIVFVSLLGIERNPFPPHYKIEKYIMKSGIPYTFLRPSFFMQNLNTTHAQDIKERNNLFVPAGNARVSFIDTRDIGQAAAHILLDPKLHKNQSYTLTGPEALTYYDAALLFTKVLGRTVTYSNPSMRSFRREMLNRGLPKGFVNIMAVLYLTTRFGMAKKVTKDLASLIGREPTSLEHYIRDHAEYWK